MEKKTMMIVTAVIGAVCCCSSSSGMCAYYMGIFGSMMAVIAGTPAATPSSAPSGVAKGSTSKACWPDQKADATCTAGCRNNKDGKCGGARTTKWDGSKWLACKWTGGDNFDCSKTCDLGSIC